MEENAETQDLIFKYLSKKKLNELLLRADNNVLQDEINKRLKTTPPIIASARVSSSNNDLEFKCSLYINYFDTQGTKLGHITFHFSPKNSTKKKSIIGRMHPKNNRNNQRKYTLRFNDTNDTIRISLSKHCSVMHPRLKECFNKSIDVINDYFSKDSDLFLGKPLFSNKKHPCFYYIVKQMEKTKTPILNTRKRGYETKFS